MPINFFDTACQESPINASLFGICDNQDGNVAYTDTTDQTAWVATVENTSRLSVIFTAIDNCIEILCANGDMDSRCDGMLTYTDNIVFVELKDQRTGWISDALGQLESSIRHFIANYNIGLFRHKRAFACNRRHPHFHVLDPELKQRFFNQYRVRVNVEAKIKV